MPDKIGRAIPEKTLNPDAVRSAVPRGVAAAVAFPGPVQYLKPPHVLESQ